MDTLLDLIRDVFSRGSEQMLGRVSGPLNLRLLITPTIAVLFAIRAGLRDARERRPPFLWQAVTQPEERKRLRRSWWKDLGRMIIVVAVMDALYQFSLFRMFYLAQTLILIVVLAMAPYAVARSITNCLARGFIGRKGGTPQPPADPASGNPEGGSRPP
jgi:hypothetical protein